MRNRDEVYTDVCPKRTVSALAIVAVALVILCVTIVAAVLAYNHQVELDAQEASIRAEYFEHNQTVTDFPHTLKFGDKIAFLSAIDILEVYVEHGYVAFVVVTIGRGELTDDDLYWMLKGERYEWELDASAYWWPDGTDNDIQSLRSLGCRYADGYIYFFFRTDHLRYSAKGKHFSVDVTYQPEGADISDYYRHSYSADFTGELYHASPDFLPAETYDQLLKSLDNWSTG